MRASTCWDLTGDGWPRLVVQLQLTATRPAQLDEQGELLRLAGVGLRVVDGHFGALPFGLAHRHVGATQQRVQVAAVLGCEGDADAGVHVDRQDRR